MSANADRQIREKVQEGYHSESRRILATLIRLIGDFDLAEDAMHEAFAVAETRRIGTFFISGGALSISGVSERLLSE